MSGLDSSPCSSFSPRKRPTCILDVEGYSRTLGKHGDRPRHLCDEDERTTPQCRRVERGADKEEMLVPAADYVTSVAAAAGDARRQRHGRFAGRRDPDPDQQHPDDSDEKGKKEASKDRQHDRVRGDSEIEKPRKEEWDLGCSLPPPAVPEKDYDNDGHAHHEYKEFKGPVGGDDTSANHDEDMPSANSRDDDSHYLESVPTKMVRPKRSPPRRGTPPRNRRSLEPVQGGRGTPRTPCHSDDEEHDDSESSQPRADPFVLIPRESPLVSDTAEASLQGRLTLSSARPSFFNNPNPTDLVELYREFCGLPPHNDSAIPGGYRVWSECRRRETGRAPVSWRQYPPYRVARALTQRAEAEAREAGHDDPLTVFARWNAEWQESGHPFWSYFAALSGSKGKVPFQSSPLPSTPKAKARTTPARAKAIRPVDLARSPVRAKRGTPLLDQNPVLESGVKRPRHSVRASTASRAGTVLPKMDGGTARPIFRAVPDPHPHYVEELAFLFHDPPELAPRNALEEAVRDLEPLPRPAFDVPTIPEELQGRWSYDPETRVLLGNLEDLDPVPQNHLHFLYDHMNDDDISVITKGCIDLSHWDFGRIVSDVATEFQNRPYHKYRQFDRQPDGSWREQPHFFAMYVLDYVRYLELVRAAPPRTPPVLEDDNGEDDPDGATPEATCRFEFRDPETRASKVIHDVRDAAIYMVDIEMTTYISNSERRFKRDFKLQDVLPGGGLDLMHAMVDKSCPHMGPNMYITPGGGFTHFHQDGYGTVDSGHLCLSGYNEVIMLRRLPERHKKNAIKILCDNSSSYDALYSLPHGEIGSQGERPSWPDCLTVRQWVDMGYCPSVFILEPNHYLHINKGRLHAFRKLTRDPLPENDCHARLRSNLIQSERFHPVPICISIAHDWMFRGHGAAGINREVAASIETSELCRTRKLQCLATPETALLNLAMSLQVQSKMRKGATFQYSSFVPSETLYCGTSMLELCRGILPSLYHIITRDYGAPASEPISEEAVLAKNSTVDMNQNPMDETKTVDPRGNDFYCILCSAELSNMYYHCNGCENHLCLDYNICQQCFNGKEFVEFRKMNPRSDCKHNSLLNHVVRYKERCPAGCTCEGGGSCRMCSRGMRCPTCGKCTACSCHCHSAFTLHYRTISPQGAMQLLQDIQRSVETANIDQVIYARETVTRLKIATDRYGEGHEQKVGLLSAILQSKPMPAVIEAEADSPPASEYVGEPVLGPLLSESETDSIDAVSRSVDLSATSPCENACAVSGTNGQTFIQEVEEVKTQLHVIGSESHVAPHATGNEIVAGSDISTTNVDSVEQPTHMEPADRHVTESQPEIETDTSNAVSANRQRKRKGAEKSRSTRERRKRASDEPARTNVPDVDAGAVLKGKAGTKGTEDESSCADNLLKLQRVKATTTNGSDCYSARCTLEKDKHPVNAALEEAIEEPEPNSVIAVGRQTKTAKRARRVCNGSPPVDLDPAEMSSSKLVPSEDTQEKTKARMQKTNIASRKRGRVANIEATVASVDQHCRAMAAEVIPDTAPTSEVLHINRDPSIAANAGEKRISKAKGRPNEIAHDGSSPLARDGTAVAASKQKPGTAANSKSRGAKSRDTNGPKKTKRDSERWKIR